MESIHEFFTINRTIILFLYGLTFFMMGLSILLTSRQRSQLRLARELRWLALFGILHGIHEWGLIFIPIQAEYLPHSFINILLTLQVLLLATSFISLMLFGASLLITYNRYLIRFVYIAGGIWTVCFMLSLSVFETIEEWHLISTIWARYLLGLPGALLAAFGLRYEATTNIMPFNKPRIYQALQIAGIALFMYAIAGGVFVSKANFFPTTFVNKNLIQDLTGIPIEVYRSFSGFILLIMIVRALSIFEFEIEQIIENMEVEHIQAAERERIGQEIHDGAIQGVYSASLILESMTPLLKDHPDAATRLNQASSVLNAVNRDLRSYMVSLRTASSPDPLIPSLKKLIADPRYRGFLDIKLLYNNPPHLPAMQITHVIAIVQEGLSNILRHANAQTVKIQVNCLEEEGTCSIKITDNGRGFDCDQISLGYGLRSMRDRARLLGGQLEVQSEIGKGTSVIFSNANGKANTI